MKWVVASVFCGLIGSSMVMASEPTKGDQPVEDVVTLSSIQFATHFELMKKMLEGEWDEKVYQQFSYYDGLVYEVIKKYETTHQGDAVWGAALKKLLDVHTQIFKEMQPLIKKRQDGERLSNKEQLWLESAGQKIWEELVR